MGIDMEIREADVMTASAASVAIKAELDQAIATAKHFPRDPEAFVRAATKLATATEEIADECMYALPRGGKTIEGPSVRFAEIVGPMWGNARVITRPVEEGDRFVSSQGLFIDLENNWHVGVEVRRRITDRNGRRYNDDMITMTVNAASAIARREAVLAGIPKAIWSPIYEAVRRKVAGDAKTLPNKRAAALAFLQKFGATQEMVVAALARQNPNVKSVDDIGLEEITILRGLAQAIKNGDTTVEEAFGEPGRKESAESGKGMSGLREAAGATT